MALPFGVPCGDRGGQARPAVGVGWVVVFSARQRASRTWARASRHDRRPGEVPQQCHRPGRAHPQGLDASGEPLAAQVAQREPLQGRLPGGGRVVGLWCSSRSVYEPPTGSPRAALVIAPVRLHGESS